MSKTRTELLTELPKVSLHDHLDGGLRPSSLGELAAMSGYRLPAADNDLASWFADAANSGDLATYLTTFDHTLACMQTAEQLHRVALEWVEDLAADGVVLGEARWAPEQHTSAGLSMDDAVCAVADGLREGMASTGIRVGQIITAMRHADNSFEVAKLALRHLDDLVIGFDIAGAEKGFRPSRHSEAFQLVQQGGLAITIHAGEDDGVASIAEALDCGAQRIGHGIRIIDDIHVDDTGVHFGSIAQRILDEGIVLEICPSSNVQTGAVSSIINHPVKQLIDYGFKITVNPDNRLMSATSSSAQYQLVADVFGLTNSDLVKISETGIDASFLDAEAKAQALAKLQAWES